MGKYMKNSKLKSSSTKIPNNATTTSSIGVRTRAKTLALQSLHTIDAAPANSSSYLQLRSRKLQKPPPPPRQKKLNQAAADDADRNGKKFGGHRVSSRLKRSSSDSESRCISRCDFDEIVCWKLDSVADEDVEASFGENFLDFEQLKRTTRESTPCSAVRDIETPGSATKWSPNPIQLPLSEINSTTQEIDDFFSSIERQEQQLFMDKYNFDFANDKPLPGGFEWEQVSAHASG